MKKGILTALIICFSSMAIAQETDTKFNAFKEKFILEMWKVYPGWASSVGYHDYDSMLIAPDGPSRMKELEFCDAQMRELRKFALPQLSDANKTDYYLIENQLQYTIWNINELKAWQWDPSMYNVCGSFADILGNEYAPLEKRIKVFFARMAKVPAYYRAAKACIKNPTIEHTQLAIDQNLGGVSVFEEDLDAALKRSKLPAAEQTEIRSRANRTAKIIREHADWLKKLDNKTPRSFRLGNNLYNRKFSYELQSGFSPNQIFAKAVMHKDELHKKMFDITKQLWPKYFSNQPMPGMLDAIKMMIGKLSENHVAADSFQSAIEKQIPMLVKFIERKKLLYIDPAKPLVVRKEPAYMAGVAGASINAPGPYDKNGNTYYNVGSLEGWDKPKAESYLKEYNHYILQILNIHEAIPGHYTQLVYANQSPSIIKSILGNNAMIEGWAVYTELMMLENGYDGDRGIDSKEASPEMWLMYYKWNLRSTCNTILDISIHTRDMTQDEGINMLTRDAFQEKTEAMGKWKRATLSQVQLCCYFTGYTEIYETREEQKYKLKDKFDLKKFHEQFLSYGSAPVKFIRQMMNGGINEPIRKL